MTPFNPLQAYQQTNVDTANPHRLVLMLYQGCIRRCREAIDALEKGDKEAAHTLLIKAQNIIAELISTLDMEAGGEIAQQLLSLYQFSHSRLVDANVKKDAAAVQEAMSIIEGIAEAWESMNPHAAPAGRSTVVNA